MEQHVESLQRPRFIDGRIITKFETMFNEI